MNNLGPCPVLRSASQRWGRRLLIAAVLLLLWAAVIAATGGFRIEIGSLRISSRNATRVARGGRPARARGVAAGLSGTTAARGQGCAGAPRATRAPTRLQSCHVRPRCPGLAWALAIALLLLGVRYGSRVAGGADAFGYVEQRRAAGAKTTRHRSVLRGCPAVARRELDRSCRWRTRRASTTSWRRPSRRSAAADGAGANAVGLCPIFRRSSLRRRPRARHLLARQTPVRRRSSAGRRGAGRVQPGRRLRVPRGDGGRACSGVLDVRPCRGVATNRSQHPRRGPAGGHRDPDPPQSAAACRVSVAAGDLPRCRCEGGGCANGALCDGERSGGPGHCVHQPAHPRIGIHLGLWRSRECLRARPRGNQPQALLRMVARESGDRRPVVRHRPVAVAGRGAPRE